MQAVEWAHFFTQPIFVPIIDWYKFFGLTADTATEVGKCESWRLVPQAAEFMGARSHNKVNSFADDWIKRLIMKRKRVLRRQSFSRQIIILLKNYKAL